MTEQYAGLSLEVDVSQVDKATVSLESFAKANDTAAKGVESFINEEQVARQKQKQFNEELKKGRAEFAALEKAIDPATSKIKNLQQAADQLDGLWKKGIVPDAKFFELSDVIGTQITALKKSRQALTEEGRAALENARAKAAAQRDGDSFLKSLQAQANAATMTKTQLLELRAAELGVSAQAAPLIAAMNNTASATNAAGISAGQYRQAMRMLPAQITDVATSLAGGMPIWLVAIQQGGQIKDSFGGIAGAIKALMTFVTPLNVAIGVTAAVMGTLVYSIYSASKEFDKIRTGIEKTTGLSGDFSATIARSIQDLSNVTGQTTDDIAQAYITTSDSALEAEKKLIDVGVSYEKASELVKKYKSEGNFTFLNGQIAEHQAKVADLKKSWTDVILEKGKALGLTALAFTSGAVADIGMRKDGIKQAGVLAQVKQLNDDITNAQKEQAKVVAETTDKIEKQYYSSNRVAGAQKQLTEAEKDLRTVRATGSKEAIAQAEDLIRIRKREVKDAIEAENKRNKPKKEKKSPIVRSPEEQLDKELYSLQAQLRTLKEHKEIGDKISSQRKALWTTEGMIAVLEEAQGKRRLSNEEQALLASQKKVLALANQKAELGDQIQEQEKLNALNDKSLAFTIQMNQQTKALKDTREMSSREAQREAERAKITSDYLAGGGKEGDSALQKMQEAQTKYYEEEDAKRADWQAGAINAFKNYGEAAADMYANVGDIASNALSGLSDMMTDFLMTGKANFADFAKSIISQIIKMITQMIIFNSISGMMGQGGISFANGFKLPGFAVGGFTGYGGKYEPKGVVHGGEFVMTKEATKRIGVDNLYKLMRGYATGGYVGGSSSNGSGGSYNGGGFSVNIGSIPVDINNGGDPKGMEQGVKAIFQQMIQESCGQGGEVYNYIQSKMGA